MRVRRYKGFSLIEIVVALLIITLITTSAVFGFRKQAEQSKIDVTTAALQTFASDMEAILDDIGVVDVEASASQLERQAKVKEYLTLIESTYTHTYFDKSTLVVTSDRFTIKTSSIQDGWGQQFILIYNINNSKGVAGTCILASAGPNLLFNDVGYGNGEFEDDVILIVKPKTI